MIVITVLLVALAVIFAVLALKRSRATGDYATLFAILAAVLVVGLGFLAVTGRLSWVAAVVAAFVPFLRRLFGLLHYLPLLRRFRGADRARPEDRPDPAQAPRATEAAPMTRDQAIAILGLGLAPTSEEVIAAHRRLMQKLHPDRGGSTYLAQQLNEAKRRLLDDLA